MIFRTPDEKHLEHWARYSVISKADYAGHLEPCSSCRRIPQVYAMDPVGAFTRHVFRSEACFAVRCSCGKTLQPYFTGKVANGAYIDETSAQRLAAEIWNWYSKQRLQPDNRQQTDRQGDPCDPPQ